MDLAFTQEQEMLRASVRDFLRTNCDRRVVRDLEQSDLGYSRDLWRRMGALGWLGIIFPEKYGGLGGGFTDLVVLLEEFGRNPYPSPYQTAVVQSGLALLELGSEAQKQALLPALVRGERVFSFALTEPSASYEPDQIVTRAFKRGDGFVISGSKLFIQYAKGADSYLVVVRTSDGAGPDQGLSLFIVDARASGVGVTPLKSMAEDKQCEVVFNQVLAPKESLVGPLDQAWPAIRKVLALSALAQSAEMAGGAQAALALAVEYTKNRVQFGRPIASFQAIQHYAANMLADSDSARYTVYEAASLVDAGLPHELQIAEAKALCSDVYLSVTSQGHQMLGGVGFYKEMDMQLWYRRAKAAEHLLGDAEYHREKIARLMGL